MGSLTKKIPKCLIPLGNSTILEHSIQKLKNLGLKDIIIVAGYFHEKIESMFDNVIVNYDYATTQTPYSLRLALEKIESGPVLILDADIIFEEGVIKEVLNCSKKSLIVSYTALSKLEAGSRIEVEDNIVMEIGRYISPTFPWQIHSGITKISADDFEYYKNLANRETFRNTEMHVLLNEFSRNRTLYVLNVERKMIRKKTGDLMMDGGSFSRISITKNDEVIKKESWDDPKRLINEISYLRSLPERVKLHFPKILEYDIKSKPVWYTMPHYDQLSLKKLILSGRFSATDAIDILSRVVKFLVEEVYTLKRELTPISYIHSVHFFRVDERKKLSMKKAPIFKKLFEAKKIIINGKEYENIFPILERIKDKTKLLANLQPPYLSMIHGDPHFDNILVDLKSSPPDFMLVDPKGFSIGDPMYDIAKLFHDFNGLYDFIYEYIFKLRWKEKNRVIKAEFFVNDCLAKEEFQTINKRFPVILEQFFKVDINWYLRVKFIEAIHFSCLQPFHIKGDGIESKAVAMYLRGVQLMNEFWEMVPPELKKKEKKYKYININTLEDFTHAKNLFEGEIPSV